MTAQPDQDPQTSVVDWRPDAAAARTWNVVGLVLTLLGVVVFAVPLLLGGVTVLDGFTFGLGDILVVAALTVLLMGVHEAIHGLVMLMVGARPTFGAMMIGKALPAFYSTAAGHRFTRGQYLAIALAPTVVISALGFVACFGPFGGYLVLPLGTHLGGCVGDLFAARRTSREPATSLCEDLRDGVRFYRASNVTSG